MHAVHKIALGAIFEFAVPPRGMLGHSLSAVSESPWNRSIAALKSLPLVCKAWHAVAFPLLYRNVVIRRVGQLPAFARTIRSSPQTFACHVRPLVVSCHVPEAYVAVIRQSLADVFALCPNLDSVSFQSFFPLVAILRPILVVTIPVDRVLVRWSNCQIA